MTVHFTNRENLKSEKGSKARKIFNPYLGR